MVSGAVETPARSAGTAFVLPADRAPHERCLIAWPGEDLVSTRLLTALKVDYGLVARAVARFEPVVVFAKPGFAREAEASCGPDVEVVELPFGAAWLRDSGPLFVRRNGRLVAVDFPFNGWGTTLPAATHGDETTASIAAWLGLERVEGPFVLEGGSIATDGEGTLLAVATSILDERRNPGLTRAGCEAAFRELLGIERTIWLEHGLLEDQTGGHVDNVAMFLEPGRVLCQTVTDRADPNHARLEANRAVLDAARDARGRRLEVVELDVLPYRAWAGRRIALPYLNLYLGNGCAIVPLACAPEDDEGLARVREALPDREVVGVPATNLARRGGGVHCITLGQPR